MKINTTGKAAQAQKTAKNNAAKSQKTLQSTQAQAQQFKKTAGAQATPEKNKAMIEQLMQLVAQLLQVVQGGSRGGTTTTSASPNPTATAPRASQSGGRPRNAQAASPAQQRSAPQTTRVDPKQLKAAMDIIAKKMGISPQALAQILDQVQQSTPAR